MAHSFTWMNLSIDILTQICEKLDDIVDRIRFGAVCHEWRKIHWECRKSIPPQPPMLLDLLEFGITFPTSNSIKHDIYFVLSKGWLIVVSVDKITLFNPFLLVDNVIQLPTLPKDIDVKRAVLSHSPAETSTYLVFIIYSFLNDDDDMGRTFAYVKSGEKSWQSVYVGVDMEDCIYYNGRFCALCRNKGRLCFDIISLIHKPEPVASLSNMREAETRVYHLVESRGDLLCIVTEYELKKNSLISKLFRSLKSKLFSWNDRQEDVHYLIGFQIFKYETKESVWKEWMSLEDGEAVFTDALSSVIVNVSKFPNYMPKHIYTHLNADEEIKVGVFNLEEGSFKFIDCKHKGLSIWVQPILNMSESGILSDSRDERMANNELGTRTYVTYDWKFLRVGY